jgi:hypothetical protein
MLLPQMSGRRRDARYRLSLPGDGVLRVVRDVVVERFEGRDVFAVGDAPEAVGMELTLEIVERGQDAGMRVRLKECTPVIVGGNVRYQLHFAIVG